MGGIIAGNAAGHTSLRDRRKMVEPSAVKNLEVVAAWKAWAEEAQNFAGDVSAADPEVSFWFASNSKTANRFFHVFASGGDGSLLAIWSEDGDAFDDAPVVLLGHEGDVYLLADDVPHALALVAASGENFEAAVLEEEETVPDAALTAWLHAAYNLPLPEGLVRDLVVEAGARLGLDALQAQVDALNHP
jgi:hypothetical protein